MVKISPERKAELIDKYRYDLVETYIWTREVMEDFNDFLWKNYEFTAKHISYCLDNGVASFDSGSIALSEFLEKTLLSKKYPEWVKRGGYIETHCSRGSFAGYLKITPEDCVILYDDQEDDAFKEAVAQLVYDKAEATYEAMANEVKNLITEMNEELFGRLQDEYEYLTSDEMVWDNIVNNEWHLEYEDEQENENAED